MADTVTDNGTAVIETAEEAISDELALKQMEAGFSGKEAPTADEVTTSTKEIEKPETAVETTGTDGTATVAEETPEKIETPEKPAAAELDPKIVQALEVISTIPDLKSTIESLRGQTFGKIGHIERVLKTLESSNQEITVTEEDLAELRKEFPETTAALAPALTRILKRVKGGVVQVPAQVDENAVLEKAATIADQIVAKRIALNDLNREHKDWQTIVGPKGSTTEFRTWVREKGEAEETRIFSSNDAAMLSGVLTEFKEFKKEKEKKANPKPAAPKTDSRTQRLAEAVQPKGGQKPPTPKAKTDEEQMEEGYTHGSGRRT